MKPSNPISGRVARRLGIASKASRIPLAKQKLVKAIPEGSHGSGTLHKRLWRLVSDYVRIRDWYKYRTCVATGVPIARWQDGDAGHFRPWTVCNGMFKFDERNIFLQSKRSNGFGEYDDWINFEAEVIRRTGMGKEELDNLNLTFQGTTINDSKVIQKMLEIIGKMAELPEKPEYYYRVTSLLIF